MTMIFIFLNKNNFSFSSLVNYFIIQEFLGLVFLIFNFSILQYFIILFKLGVAPFHFWIFSIINNINGFGVVWFLTFQKLPFIPVFFYFFSFSFFYFLLFGVIFCCLQIFICKSYKGILVISSTESFNWILIICSFSIFSSLFFVFYYFFFLFFVLKYNNTRDVGFYSWELVLVFMNLPFSVSFFIKFFSLCSLFIFSSFIGLFLLFLLFLSILSFSFWMLNISVKFYYDGFLNDNFYLFLIYPLMFFCLIYQISKIYYTILIGWSSFGFDKSFSIIWVFFVVDEVVN